ncbi:MAG: hypothetical protein ACREXU_08505 [Gammaproteobacteria bacterium]
MTVCAAEVVRRCCGPNRSSGRGTVDRRPARREGRRPVPQGRLLDLRRPPARGLVLGRDLGTVDDEATVEATFDPPPNAADYAYFGTNDHDLVVLPNGDGRTGRGARARAGEAAGGAVDVSQIAIIRRAVMPVSRPWRSACAGSRFVVAEV